MVEGHSVHRIASRFRDRLVGKTFLASSPNGRFVEGSKAIDGRVLSNVEAIGKNLFAFFSSPTEAGASANIPARDDDVVCHVHFGMAGAWAVFNHMEEPETKPTTRLRLEETTASSSTGTSSTTTRLVAHLSAMTCNHGGIDLYESKRACLGQDPLRPDADPDALYSKIIAMKSKKSIGQLIMDQSFFAGPGNIYRAEILFLAGVYPTTPGADLDRASFDRIWGASVKLLRRGYDAGSIITVDADVDPEVAASGERRYIYNRSDCARCGGPVKSWDMSGRTCYACHGGCQPKHLLSGVDSGDDAKSPTKRTTNQKGAVAKATPEMMSESPSVKTETDDEDPSSDRHVPFISSCARDGYHERLARLGPAGLTISEIRSHLEFLLGPDADADALMPPKRARKAVHVEALVAALAVEDAAATKKEDEASSTYLPPPKVSAEDAAREKAAAGEHRGVEHVAELSGEQAVGAIYSGRKKREEEEKKEKTSKYSKSARKSGGNRAASTKRKARENRGAGTSRRRLEFD